MSNKSVLVNYLERNNVLTILASTDFRDILFLEREFWKEFKFHGNVNVGITFQRFDKAWEEYVDVDKGCQLDNREKLKAVVLPLLSDISQSATPSDAQLDVVRYMSFENIDIIIIISRQQVKCLQLVVLYFMTMMMNWALTWRLIAI